MLARVRRSWYAGEAQITNCGSATRDARKTRAGSVGVGPAFCSDLVTVLLNGGICGAGYLTQGRSRVGRGGSRGIGSKEGFPAVPGDDQAAAVKDPHCVPVVVGDAELGGER
jgi:hypothetical protein